jgi:hypothetical protein
MTKTFSQAWFIIRLLFCGIATLFVGMSLALQGNGNWIWSGFFVGSVLGAALSALVFFGLAPLLRYFRQASSRRH